MKSLCWTIVLLLMIMYAIGVYLTQLASDHLIELTKTADAEAWNAAGELRDYFGSLGDAVFSLYQSITGGINWKDLATPLMDQISPWMSVFVSAYVAFCVLALMNIVTGVFVESALQTAKSDKENFMLNLVQELFDKVDSDGSGEVTWDEFRQYLKEPEMIMYFEAFDLDIDEAEDLFQLLDLDESGSIGFEEFANGCFRLRGPAKSMDLAALGKILEQ